MKKFTIIMRGTSPLLMHSAQLSDEFNPVTLAMKKITSKKTNKTEDDRWELRRLEFAGSLYFDADLGPYIPAENIEASIANAASLTRKGKDVKRGMKIVNAVNPLAYHGPRTIDELWAKRDEFAHFASVKVQTARVTRTRPIFREWACEADGIYDPNVIDQESLESWIEKSGQLIGLGDWRPRFGTFEVTFKEH